ncbi:MAG: tetratricopeptide repeat protein [bacterium]
MENNSKLESKTLPVLAVLLPALVAGIVFANSLRGGFVYDDRPLVTQNEAIRDLSALGIYDIFTHADYQSYAPHYLPVRVLSYAIDYMIWGMNPYGFHLTNLVLHILNVMLAALLVAAITGAAGGEEGRFRWLAGGVAAMLFAAHPLMSESVAWIAGRKDLLATCFSICAALCYLKSFRRPLSKKTDWPIAAGLLFFALAMMSKATAAALPAAFLAFEILLKPGEGRGRLRLRIERLAPFFVLTAALVFIDANLSVKNGMIENWFGGSLFTHLITIATIPLLYLGKFIWPARLCVDYATLAQKSLFSPLVLASLLFWFASAFWFVKRGRAAAAPAALAAWAILNLAPAMNFAPTSKLIADRYVYLPAVGLFGLVGYLFARAASARGAAARLAAFALLAAVVAGFGVLTAARNRDWRSELTLWRSADKIEPRNPVVTHGLGYAYFEIKDYGKAERYFRETIKTDPNFKLAYFNLGVLESQIYGRDDEAISLFNKALKIDPRDARTRANLALAYFNKGEYDKAHDEMLRAVDTSPDDFTLVRRMLAIKNSYAIRGRPFVIPQKLLDKINGKKKAK